MSHSVQFISVLFINRKNFNFSSYLICCAISQGSESVKSCINIVVHQIMVVKIFFIIAFSLSVLYLSVFEESTLFFPFFLFCCGCILNSKRNAKICYS